MSSELNRPEFFQASDAAMAGGGPPNQSASGAAARSEPPAGAVTRPAPEQQGAPGGSRPNVVYFHVDNLGYGELGCYGGGILRGADTRRIDQFAHEGFQLLNYAPEAQCTPSRSALLTGRHAIRSGNHTVPVAEAGGSGLVAWERTLGDVFSEAGYATLCMGKWHIGEGDGRW